MNTTTLPLHNANAARTFFAPGRVNIIGEHIDYNGGAVFPAAISLGTTLHFTPNDSGRIRLESIGHPSHGFEISEPLRFDTAAGWANYPKGIFAELHKQGIALSSGTYSYTSTLPIAAGLSSSAAMGVLTAFAARSLQNTPIDRTALALEAQCAENKFIGVPCGIMDQFVVANGQANNALLLNCATLAHRHIPLALGNYELVIINSNKARKLADSLYQERKEECDRALTWLRRSDPALPNLASASVHHLTEISDPILRKRAYHVVSENKRVQDAVAALETGNLKALGELLDASHESLHQQYEVAGYELDALVRGAQAFAGCIGARMTGAGFGGCAIALVERDAVTEFEVFVNKTYENRTGLRANFYACSISDGVHEITASV